MHFKRFLSPLRKGSGPKSISHPFRSSTNPCRCKHVAKQRAARGGRFCCFTGPEYVERAKNAGQVSMVFLWFFYGGAFLASLKEDISPLEEHAISEGNRESPRGGSQAFFVRFYFEGQIP